MVTLFVLCHEGEIPYVMNGLRDALYETPTVQIVDQGSTEKMHLGSIVLCGAGGLPTALLAELLSNPDVSLYTPPLREATVEGSAELGDGTWKGEPGAPNWWEEPVPIESSSP
jgi:hypothetical protein